MCSSVSHYLEQTTKVRCTNLNHFWLFCFRPSSVTERVKIENPKVLNLVLQNANLLVTEKNYNAGMCDVVLCPIDETAIYYLKRILISKRVK